MLGDCSPEAAESKRQELQRRIEDISMPSIPRSLRVGASAGAAMYPHDGDTYEALLATADRRMYSDKALRRRFATMQPAAADPANPPPRHQSA